MIAGVCMSSISKLALADDFKYGRKENPGFESSIDEQVTSLTNLIERKYLSAESETRRMDLGELISVGLDTSKCKSIRIILISTVLYAGCNNRPHIRSCIRISSQGWRRV